MNYVTNLEGHTVQFRVAVSLPGKNTIDAPCYNLEDLTEHINRVLRLMPDDVSIRIYKDIIPMTPAQWEQLRRDEHEY